MDERKHSTGSYRTGSGGAPVNDGRGGGGSQRYMSGRGNGGRGDHRRPRERDGREQRMRSGRGGRVRILVVWCGGNSVYTVGLRSLKALASPPGFF